MPGRAALISLFLFWFASLTWQFFVVVWPVLRTGDPPGAGISLSDETTASAPARYRIFFNGQEVALARLELSHQPARDVFQSQAEFSALGVKLLPGQRLPTGSGWLPAKSTLEVDREGQPLAASSQIKIPTGEVNSILTRQGSLMTGTKTIRLLASPDIPIPGQNLEIPIGEGRAVLSLLHPTWRWNGLRPGQKWTARVLDPLADSLLTTSQAHSGQPVACEVSRTLEIPPDSPKKTECWKITATREDLEVTIWVAIQGGKVMRQRVRQGSGPGADLWDLIREDVLPS